jgi:hypothetical protein
MYAGVELRCQWEVTGGEAQPGGGTGATALEFCPLSAPDKGVTPLLQVVGLRNA